MDTEHINTGLEGFILIKRVLYLDEKRIQTIFRVPQFKSFTLMESMAQSCALHARFLTELNRFVFLLKIEECMYPDLKSSNFTIDCELEVRSERAFSYNITAKSKDDIFYAKMVFAAEDFKDSSFKKRYRNHYKKVFRCLTKSSEENWK